MGLFSSRRPRRWLRRLLIALVVLVVGSLGFLYWSVRRPFPKTDGTLTVAGLQGGVDVFRDQMGVPHVYASSPHDLFFTQGFLHAQDRFWQMDVWRHISSGRLAEMFGEDQVETDAFLRTLGWQSIAAQEWEQASPQLREALQAYADGVNAYLETKSPAELAFEYTVLEAINRAYDPAPWKPEQTLAWGKVMAWDLRGNLDEEIGRSLLSSLPGFEDLYPPYPESHPTIVGGTGAAASVSSVGYPGIDQGLRVVQAKLERVEALTGKAGTGIGSNSWVIHGSRTASGKPILANDPHLSIQMPSIWYQIGLHCQPKGVACPLEVAGFSFAGVPGVVIGHNDRIAWGFTNLGPDVMDLYIEKMNPINPDEYEVNGAWERVTKRTETIKVAGGDPVEIDVRVTRHGPLIDARYEPIEEFETKAGIDLPDHFGLALRWTALEPVRTFEAILGFDRAQNWDEFREAASVFDLPAQNLVYADVDGNIGYQAPGKIPIRAGGDGRMPVPGWTDANEWTGFIPFEELPSALNPEAGFLVTANNAVVASDYPYLLTHDWNYGHRARRLVDLVSTKQNVTLEDVAGWQNDNYNLNAQRLLPYLVSLDVGEGLPRQALGILEQWDLMNDADSAGAAIFEVVWREILRRSLEDDFPSEVDVEGGSRLYVAMENLAKNPNSRWWDDHNTTTFVEDRDAILRQAFAAAVEFLEDRFGKDPRRWEWGKLHTATFRNQTLGDSGIGLIEGRFNRGPFATSGGEDIVNATGWSIEEGFEVDWVPSMRMIVDLSDLDASRTVHTTGQSGHSGHEHYQDMVDRWRKGEYYPMHWDRSSVEADTEGHLHLQP